MDRNQRIRIRLGLILVAVLGIGGFVRWRHETISNPESRGETMGTTYSIRLSGEFHKDQLKHLTALIEKKLQAIDLQMSTWNPDSEISRFNHSLTTEPVPVSAAFAEVVTQALVLSKSSGGAFDPTLQPLLNLWGFGSEAEQMRVPTDDEIAACRAGTGWEKILVRDGTALQKSDPAVSLALGAIAKGYGADVIADVLRDSGFSDWFVEIGGEVVVSGTNPSGVPWKIGIQHPDVMEDASALQGILHLETGAVATSGDYRNYMMENGVLYSHILDPRSGRAVRSDVASVSVYAPDCMRADGIATALFVMGPDDGLEWVEQSPGVEALFLVRENGMMLEKFSSGFAETTGYTSIERSNRSDLIPENTEKE